MLPTYVRSATNRLRLSNRELFTGLNNKAVRPERTGKSFPSDRRVSGQPRTGAIEIEAEQNIYGWGYGPARNFMRAIGLGGDRLYGWGGFCQTDNETLAQLWPWQFGAGTQE